MANLLQKASIVLTPTAYDNGKVLCAKPSEAPYGDFDFSRNSAATRVNAQGLVENVQILSSNLVQNSDFSEEGVQEVSNGSFSQEGVQLVTNGDFSNGTTNWSNPTYSGDNSASLSIDNGTLKIEKNADLDWRSSFVSQTPIVYVSGKTYKITYSLKDGNTSGADVYVRTNFARSASTVDIKTLTSDWVEYTDYYVADASADDISFGILAWQNAGNGEYYFIDNVSVREVGQDWSLIGTATITENQANIVTASAVTGISQSNILTVGKSYKLSYNIVSNNNGGLKISGNEIPSVVGNNTYYFEASTASLEILRNSGITDISITNISVKEVGQDWTLGTGVSIGSNEAVFTSTPSGQSVGQNAVAAALPNGALAKVSFEVLTRTEGTFGIYFSGTLVGTLASAGVFTGYFTKGTETSFYIRALGTTSGTISNVNVIQITDDTNLPRINYEGFSYQDDLGSEEIVNGGFDTNLNNWVAYSNTLISWESGGYALLNSNNNYWCKIKQSNVFEIGKTYKVILTAKSNRTDLNFHNSPITGSFSQADTFETFDQYYTATSTDFLFGYANAGSSTITIDNVSVKEYLGQEVVPNSGCGSWLFESQSTNLITYSSDYTQWNKSGSMVITSNNAISPDGTQNASLLTANAANQFIYLSSFSSANSTISLYIKRKTGTGNIELSNNGGASYTALSVTDEWNRVQVTFAASTNQTVIKINTSGDEIYLWGVQLEALSYASSLIPTSGSQVTRNQDVCNNGATGAGLINSTEGVLYAEVAALADGVGTRTMSLSDGTANNSITIRYTTSVGVIQAFVVSGGSFQFNANISGVSVLNFNKVAIKYSLNDMALWINGVEVATDTSGTMPLGLNEINFTRGDGANKFFGKTKALAVWKEALTDQELADLTYPTPTDPTFSLDFDTIAEQFTFTRGSEATYVDAQGLIQSTNELGEELITNGDFATDTGWAKQAGWTISGGTANANMILGGNGNIYQSALVSGKTYELTFTVSNYVQGNIRNVSQASNLWTEYNSNGTFTEIFVANTANLFINANVGALTQLSIDNVSVKEVISATNTPRLDYSTGAEAFLLEPQSTNLVTYSEDFSDFSWIKNNTAITSNYSVSPSGDVSASRFLASSNAFLYDGFNVIIGAEYTISFWVKSNGSLNNFFLHVNGNNSPTFTATDVWQRFEHTFTAVNASHNIGISCSSSGADLQIWGAQLEEGYATSYIPSNGSQTTRNQEQSSKNNVNELLDGNVGSIYLAYDGVSSNGTTLNNMSPFRLYGQYNNKIRLYYAPDADFLGTSVSFENGGKIAWSCNGTTILTYIDGVLIDTHTITNNFTTLSNFVLSTSFMTHRITDIKIYPKALLDAELIKLTT